MNKPAHGALSTEGLWASWVLPLCCLPVSQGECTTSIWIHSCMACFVAFEFPWHHSNRPYFTERHGLCVLLCYVWAQIFHIFHKYCFYSCGLNPQWVQISLVPSGALLGYADVCQGSALQVLCLYCTHAHVHAEGDLCLRCTPVSLFIQCVWYNTCHHIRWHVLRQRGEKGGFPARTHICHVSQATLSKALARVAWTGEHGKNKPTGLVEHLNTCLRDAQNQTGKAASLS